MSDCYDTGYICQVVDNFAFKVQSGNIYQTVLNAHGECCVSIPRLVITSRFGRTFKENDPYRMIEEGREPTEAAFDDKIDGYYFKPDICNNDQFETELNVEPVNMYEYVLSSLQTEYTETQPLTGDPATLTQSRDEINGTIYIRNTIGDNIDTIYNLLPNIKYLPEIYNNIIDYDIVYDNIIVYTDNILYIENINYNYSTGQYVANTITPVILSATDHPNDRVMKSHFDPDLQEIMVGAIRPVAGNLVVPQLYRYNANTHVFNVAYDGLTNVNDHVKLTLPPDLFYDFVFCKINTPVITYNPKIQKYTVIAVASLSATPEAIAAAGEFDSLLGEFFCVVMYNFKSYRSGLELIDSTVFHAPNKRQLRYEKTPSTKYIDLSSTNEFIDMGEITDPNTKIVVNFRTCPVRESKLKSVSVTYNNKTYIEYRRPVNDMFYSDLDHVNNLVEGYIPHKDGGPTDFASPRYQDIPIDLDLNLNEVSTVTLSGEAVYYDGHVEKYKFYGESRPLPISAVFEKMSLVQAVSYTTDTRSNLIKLTFETQNPNYLTEILIDNGSLSESTSDILTQRNLFSPSLSTEASVNDELS